MWKSSEELPCELFFGGGAIFVDTEVGVPILDLQDRRGFLKCLRMKVWGGGIAR